MEGRCMLAFVVAVPEALVRFSKNKNTPRAFSFWPPAKKRTPPSRVLPPTVPRFAIFKRSSRSFLSSAVVYALLPPPAMKLTRRRCRVCAFVPVVWAALIVATAGRVGVVSRRPVDCDFVCKVRVHRPPPWTKGWRLVLHYCIVQKYSWYRQQFSSV